MGVFWSSDGVAVVVVVSEVPGCVGVDWLFAAPAVDGFGFHELLPFAAFCLECFAVASLFACAALFVECALACGAGSLAVGEDGRAVVAASSSHASGPLYVARYLLLMRVPVFIYGS